jgi:hypothetical protein
MAAAGSLLSDFGRRYEDPAGFAIPGLLDDAHGFLDMDDAMLDVCPHSPLMADEASADEAVPAVATANDDRALVDADTGVWMTRTIAGQPAAIMAALGPEDWLAVAQLLLIKNSAVGSRERSGK